MSVDQFAPKWVCVQAVQEGTVVFSAAFIGDAQEPLADSAVYLCKGLPYDQGSMYGAAAAQRLHALVDAMYPGLVWRARVLDTDPFTLPPKRPWE